MSIPNYQRCSLCKADRDELYDAVQWLCEACVAMLARGHVNIIHPPALPAPVELTERETYLKRWRELHKTERVIYQKRYYEKNAVRKKVARATRSPLPAPITINSTTGGALRA